MFVLLLAVAAMTSSANAMPMLGVDPVADLNLTSYLGTWYQMYGDLLVDKTFESGGWCVRAQYR